MFNFPMLFLATDPVVGVSFLALPDFLRSSGSVTDQPLSACRVLSVEKEAGLKL
jgi:hypothetical protein